MRAGTGNSGGGRRPGVRVTDELLSAYIDGEVTPEEREAVEEAVARDPDVAFRLQTLQHTVSLLSNLPRASLPRAFTLSEADVAPGRRVPFWRRWRGPTLSLYLRGATALAATLLIVLLVGDFWLSGQLAVGSRAPASLERKQAVAVEEAEVPAATTEVALKAESIPAQEEGLPTQEATPGAPPPAPLVMEKVEAPEAPPAEGQVPKGAGGEAAPEVRTLVAPPLEVPAAAEEEPAVVARKAPPGAPQPAAPESPTAETAVAAGQPPAVAPAAPEGATATAQAGALAPPIPAPPTIAATQVAAPAPATPTPVPLAKAPERAPGRGPVPEGESGWVEGGEERLFGVPIAWIRALEVILVAAVVILGVASWLTRAR